MICFSTCSSDPAHVEIPTGFSNSPAKPIESRQEAVRSLKMLSCVLSSREINLRKMHIKHYQDGCLILQGVLYLRVCSQNHPQTIIQKGPKLWQTEEKAFILHLSNLIHYSLQTNKNYLCINYSFIKLYVLHCIYL